MNFTSLYLAAMRKRAAAILTPEAEQAAVQGPGAGGAPVDPSMGGGMPPEGGAPMDPSMMQGGGGMPPGAAGPNGGEIPPEILQDQGFIQWLASQGVQLDPQSGTFIEMQSGQPLPADAIMQAYQAYMQQVQQMQGGDMGGGMPPEGGAPMDPSMGGGMPPEGGAPMDPSMMQGGGGMPPEGGELPPELLQDPGFAQFLEEALGAQLDPQSGQVMDMQSGQPLPPDVLMQAAQAYMQQMQGGDMGGGMPPEGGAPMDPAMMQGGAPMDPSMGGGMPPEGGAPMDPSMGGGMPPEGSAPTDPSMGGGMPPEVMNEIQKAVDTSIKNYTAQLDKKIETLLDKLETVKQAIESFRDTEDKRTEADKDENKELQDEIAAELNPVTKTASVKAVVKKYRRPAAPVSVFDLLVGGK